MRTVAVVLAGGSGERFGGGLPKQLLPLAGRPLIEHSMLAFEQAPGVDSILVVMATDHTDRVRDLLTAGRYQKLTKIIDGGASRVESTRNAIAELGEDECDVLFHDAARPLVDQRIIADCLAALATHQAVGTAVPCSDTIAVVGDGVMTAIPHRDSLVRCQTPQGFRLSVIRRAHALAAADPASGDLPATDDCGIVLRYLPEVGVHLVPGSERNIKITYPRDLHIAETLLAG
ncbi:MAG: 2-C-methyl-D-erythritol 4-phosphate cytidylyltransferase [Actinobacteria bacterium]|nr:2-C-methyl-D-erythritol 4-phosphate cytidylyltransferase [Actinomycetota bacterium]